VTSARCSSSATPLSVPAVPRKVDPVGAPHANFKEDSQDISTATRSSDTYQGGNARDARLGGFLLPSYVQRRSATRVAVPARQSVEARDRDRRRFHSVGDDRLSTERPLPD